MLSKFFSNRGGHHHRKQSGSSSNRQNTALLKGVDDRKTQLESLKGADRQLYSYDKPTQELGITDLLKQHEPGSRFLYAAVTGREDEDGDSRLNKLRAWRPFLNTNVQSFDNVPNLKLYKESEVFPIKPLIDSLLTKTKKTSLRQDYFRVVEAMVIYGAIVSADQTFTKVRIAINDNRLLGSTHAKGFVADTNKESRGDLRMSYCVPVDNADMINLVISREQQFLQDGLQWGAIKIKLSLEFTDFPKQYDNLEVKATNMLVSTVLDADRTTDPDVLDISVSNSARLGLARLYQSGDLADLEEPTKNAKSLRSAKSSIRDKPKGDQKSFGEGWGNMAIPRGNSSIASIEPDDDESDTASDVARRQELLKVSMQNQEMLRQYIAQNEEFVADNQSSRMQVSEEDSDQVVRKTPRFDDELNMFD